MITAIIVTVLVCCALVIIKAICEFVSYANQLFNGSSPSQTDGDPHTYVDARNLPHSKKKGKQKTDNRVSTRHSDEYDNERERIELLYGDEHYACGDRD